MSNSGGLEAISRVLADPGSAVPELIRGSARLLVEKIRLLEAHICYASLRDKTPFGETERLNRKINRETFVMPA